MIACCEHDPRMMMIAKMTGKAVLPWVPTGLAFAAIELANLKELAQTTMFICASVSSLVVAWSTLKKIRNNKRK